MKTLQFPYFIIAILLCSNTVNSQNKFWERHVIDTSISGADGVKLADVNGDHLMDITTGWEEGGVTKVYINPGYKHVKEKWPAVAVGKTKDVEDAVFMDVDNDGVMDVVSCTEGGNKKMYVHWGPKRSKNYLKPTKWETAVLPASDGLSQWMYAVPAQIDGVNGVDIIAGSKNKNAQIGWFESPKNPRELAQWKWHPISEATWVMSIFVRDMDGDGDDDIVVSDRKPGESNGVRWLENPGTIDKQKQFWKSHFIGCQGLQVMFMDLADLDGDGLEDAIVTESTHKKIVFLKRLDATGLNWSSYTIDTPTNTGTAKSVVAGDIDLDGKLDLVHSTEHVTDNKEGVFWLSYKVHPTEKEWKWNPISGPVGVKYDKIELIDLDGDGDLDVLTCEENYGDDSYGLGVIWYENPTR